MLLGRSTRSLCVLLPILLLAMPVTALAKTKHHKHSHRHHSVKPQKPCPDMQRLLAETRGTESHITAKSDKYKKTTGLASWYGPGFHGRKTASGERFNMHALTAAHKTLPLGTRVQVRNLDNNRSVIVVINDRGPFVPSRIIDLSKGAAQAINMAGTERVELTVLERG